MNTKSVELTNDLVVIGLARAITPDVATTEIPALWARFMSEGAMAKIGAPADGHLYAVYCDYVSDFLGPYTMVLGIAVPAPTEVPHGMRRVRVPAGTYASFVANGDPKEVIWKAWSYVNGEWPARTTRRYMADCERYALGTMSPSSVEAQLLVGVDRRVSVGDAHADFGA